MRNDIVAPGAGELKYEIREIASIGYEMEKMGRRIFWENIGDPVKKGEKIPDWIKDIVKKAASDDSTYSYSPTKGLDSTREFIAMQTNSRGGIQITKEDVVFFNGIGDAISKVYGLLKKESRVIGPSPAYSTHSSSEAAHAGSDPLTYRCDPENNWYPDMEDLRNKVRYNPSVSGIMVINPNNPTGSIYPRDIMEGIIGIAKEYDLFVICDEIYANINYNGKKPVLLGDVIGDVCGISMKGISKEFPWPGARCGWIEVYNEEKDSNFEAYVKSIVNDKMLEVCSTTLPQSVIPEILSDSRYEEYHKERNREFARRSALAYETLKDTDGIIVNRAEGAFYMTVVFKDGVLDGSQSLELDDPKLKEYVERVSDGVKPDKRFAYYLMAKTGICVVPLTGFECGMNGFRVTLLESDRDRFEWVFKTIKESIEEYIAS
ncbi:MAG: aminotransferase [Candidatus Aenigmatarchaeota archaeon]|nr:MAG: aminotransferase [Candidatus Aenigmarchaeota archaeon]